MKILNYISCLAILLIGFGCKKPDLSNIIEGSVYDNSGNSYKTVEIGNQVWMAENLQTIKFSNGDSIYHVKGDSAWAVADDNSYVYFDNLQPVEVPEGFGKIYNYGTANNSKNPCPNGWHLPSEDEWDELVDYLGGKYVAGEKLKSTDPNSWFLTIDPEPVATNESLFTALPAGYRNKSGAFNNERYFAYFWTSTLDKSDSVIVKSMHYGSRAVSTILMDQNDGASVRCIQD